MSKQLLYHLNGNTNGAFRRWLDHFQGEPRIAWYPSASGDFRDLLYLNPAFLKAHPSPRPEPAPPDFFLHTTIGGYFQEVRWPVQELLKIYEAGRSPLNGGELGVPQNTWNVPTWAEANQNNKEDTEMEIPPTIYPGVTVNAMEELPRLDLPVDDRIIYHPYDDSHTGRVLFLEVQIQSKDLQGNFLGTFTRPLIFVYAENAAFCAKKILPQQGRFSHVIHVCYGGGCGGGGYSTGIWLLNILRKVNCEMFVTEGQKGRQDGDERVYRLFRELRGPEDEVHVRDLIRENNEILWPRVYDWKRPA